jgi:hypothetical protein
MSYFWNKASGTPMKNESNEIVSLKDEIYVLKIEIDNLKRKVRDMESEIDRRKKRGGA